MSERKINRVLLLKEYLKRIVEIRGCDDSILDYDIVYELVIEFRENCIVIKFHVRIKDEETVRDMTLVLYRRRDGTLTGNSMIGYESTDDCGIRVDVKLDAIPLHELEDILYGI